MTFRPETSNFDWQCSPHISGYTLTECPEIYIYILCNDDAREPDNTGLKSSTEISL